MPLPNVPGKILSKVIEYCKFHVDNSRDSSKPSSSQGVKSEEEIKAWDADFMKIDQSTLFEVILVKLLLLGSIKLPIHKCRPHCTVIFSNALCFDSFAIFIYVSGSR